MSIEYRQVFDLREGDTVLVGPARVPREVSHIERRYTTDGQPQAYVFWTDGLRSIFKANARLTIRS